MLVVPDMFDSIQHGCAGVVFLSFHVIQSSVTVRITCETGNVRLWPEILYIEASLGGLLIKLYLWVNIHILEIFCCMALLHIVNNLALVSIIVIHSLSYRMIMLHEYPTHLCGLEALYSFRTRLEVIQRSLIYTTYSNVVIQMVSLQDCSMLPELLLMIPLVNLVSKCCLSKKEVKQATEV